MKTPLSIFVLAVLIYILNKTIEKRKEAQTSAHQEAFTPLPSTRNLPKQTSRTSYQNPTDISQRELKATGLIRLDSNDIPVLFNAPHISLTDEEILERIEAGVAYIESSPNPGPFASYLRPNVTVTSIDQACVLLYRTTPIPGGWFPQWGYEVDDYYIFSGGARRSAEDAFMEGFAIQKNNGRSWQYYDAPIPIGKRRTGKGPRPDDYPPSD